MGVADIGEAEGTRVSPSLKSEGRTVSPPKMNPE